MALASEFFDLVVLSADESKSDVIRETVILNTLIETGRSDWFDSEIQFDHD